MVTHTEEMRNLVDKLGSLTDKRDLTWKTSGDENSAYAQMKSGKIEIKTSFDTDGQDAIRITLVGIDGNLKLSFDDTDIVGKNEYSGQIESYYPKMRDLLLSAIRYARGEDVILRNFIDELEEKENNSLY